jgi:hypothetical protein
MPNWVQGNLIYDPTADYLPPPLLAFELSGSGYVPMQSLNDVESTGSAASPCAGREWAIEVTFLPRNSILQTWHFKLRTGSSEAAAYE